MKRIAFFDYHHIQFSSFSNFRPFDIQNVYAFERNQKFLTWIWHQSFNNMGSILFYGYSGWERRPTVAIHSFKNYKFSPNLINYWLTLLSAYSCRLAIFTTVYSPWCRIIVADEPASVIQTCVFSSGYNSNEFMIVPSIKAPVKLLKLNIKFKWI